MSTTFRTESPPLWRNFGAELNFSVGNSQLSVGKLQLSAPPTFLSHDLMF